jgi:MFS family permease
VPARDAEILGGVESTPLPLKRDPLEAIRAAFGTANLRRLQFGWAASSVGSWAFMVVLAVYAYDVGGASAVGVAALVRMLPAAFAAPITSLLADRSSRRCRWRRSRTSRPGSSRSR